MASHHIQTNLFQFVFGADQGDRDHGGSRSAVRRAKHPDQAHAAAASRVKGCVEGLGLRVGEVTCCDHDHELLCFLRRAGAVVLASSSLNSQTLQPFSGVSLGIRV